MRAIRNKLFQTTTKPMKEEKNHDRYYRTLFKKVKIARGIKQQSEVYKESLLS